MSSFGSFARVVGSAGNDAANAVFANRDQATQAAADKLKQLMAQLQIQEIQQKLSAFGQAQPEGVQKTPDGGLAGFTYSPATGYKMQQLTPGAPPAVDKEKFRSSLLEYANRPDATPLEKRVMSGLIGSLDAGMAPEKVMEDYNRFLSSRSESGTPPKEELKTEVFGGYRWQYDPTGKVPGPRDATKQYVRLGPAKEPGTGEGGTKTPFELWLKTHPGGSYDDWIADSAKTKPIPPDVLNLLKTPPPENPSPGDSQRLAQAADRVFGGTAHRQDLLTRGRKPGLPIIGRAHYESAAYSKAEYQDILNSIKDAVGDVGGPTIPPPPGPPPGRTGTISTH